MLNKSRHLADLIAALLVGVGFCAAGTARAKPDEAPYVYGPPPDWGQFKQLAEQAVRLRLVDPDSAKFVWPHGYKQTAYKPILEKRVYGYATCGLVNSRNRMGGYVGDTYFAVVIDYGKVVYVAIADAKGGDILSQSCARSSFPPPPLESVNMASPMAVEFTGTAAGAVVTGVAPESPAARAGLKTAMVVVRINGIGVKGMSADLLRQMLAGIEGTASLELASGDVIRVPAR